MVGLGTWRLRGVEATSVVSTALQLGYRHLDTATMYGNEADIGRALVGTDGVFVTTKLPAERVGDARRTLESSLTALGVEAVDLWLMHWPPEDVVAAWEAMLALRDEGLARAVGVSNYSTAQVDSLVAATGAAPAVNQVPWSPLAWDPDLLEHHRRLGVIVGGYSPLKGGAARRPAVEAIAAARRCTPEQVVLRWHVQQGIVVIPKSVHAGRLAANLDILDWTLDDAEMTTLSALT